MMELEHNGAGAKGSFPTVLHVIGARQDMGGILSAVRSLAHAASASEFQHVAVHADGFQEVRKPALQYFTNRWLYADMYPHLFLLLGGSFLAALALLRGRGVPTHDVAVVHAHTRGGIVCAVFIALFSKIPVVITNHTYARNRWLYRWLTQCKRITSVFLTPAMVSYYGVDPNVDNVAVISEGFNPSLLDEELSGSRFARGLASYSSAAPLRLLGIGSFFPWKKWNTIIEALLLLPPSVSVCVRFDHWGDVPHEFEGEYRRLLDTVRDADLEDRVSFHGAVPSVRAEMQTADALVVASVNEPCSLALLEGLAIGLPVLAADSGGNLDIIRKGENGMFFETGNATALARVLDGIVQGRLSLQGIPATIRAGVRPRNGNAIASAYHELYRQCIRKRARAT